MSFLNFPKQLAVKVLDSSESYNLGAYKAPTNTELYALRLKLFVKGTMAVGTKVKVEIYANSNYAGKVGDTEEITLQDGNYLGFQRLILTKTLNMKADQFYYFKIVPTGYTRNIDTTYIGIVLDYPYGVYNSSDKYPPFVPASMELYGLY